MCVAECPLCLCLCDGPPPPPEAPSQGLPELLSPCLSCRQLFHEAAYQADDRQDLLSAISEFLDGSIVIPPSEVEGRDLLRSVAAFQRELLRKRREREQTKVEMTTRGGYTAPGKGQTLWGPESPADMLPTWLLRPCPRLGRSEPGVPEQESVVCSSSPLFPQNCLWSWVALRRPLKMTPCCGLAQCSGGSSGM